MPRLAVQYLELVAIALLMTAGQLLLKQGMGSMGPLSFRPSVFFPLVRHVLTTPTLLAGWLCGTLGTLVWLVALSRLELSYASPTLTGMYFVLMLFASRLFLGESMTPWKWGGVALVILGMLVASHDAAQPPTPSRIPASPIAG